jgi:hypothetical protein
METTMTDLTPAQKITARIQAYNAKVAEREILAKHREEVEARRAAGPTKEQKFIERHLKQVYENLKHMRSDVSFQPVEFKEADITIEDGKVYGWYGYTSPEIKLPKGYYVSISFHEVWESGYSSFSSRRTGKYRVHIGPYGRDGRDFRQLKDGTFKYYEMACELNSRLNDITRQLAHQAKVSANKSSVQTVLEGLDEEFKPWNGVELESTASEEKPVMVKVSVTRGMSVEKATELLKVLKTFGIG